MATRLLLLRGQGFRARGTDTGRSALGQGTKSLPREPLGGRVVLEVDVGITTRGSSRAFRSVDHHVANRNCARALRERPAYGDGLGVRAFHSSTEHSSRPISFPSPCAGARLVLLMSTLLEFRRSDLNFARHQVATSCSAMFRSPSHSQLQAASHCSANAHKSLTTQGAKNAQAPTHSRSVPARNGCADFTPEMPQPTASAGPLPIPVSTSRATRSILNVRVAG